jgi:hypothetical protein
MYKFNYFSKLIFIHSVTEKKNCGAVRMEDLRVQTKQVKCMKNGHKTNIIVYNESNSASEPIQLKHILSKCLHYTKCYA